VAPLLSCDEKLWVRLEDLLGIPPDVVECIAPISRELEIPITAVEHCLQVGRHQVAAGAILARGIPTHKDRVVVPTVSGSVCLAYTTGDDQPPKPGSGRQPHEGVSEHAGKGGKADEQGLIEGAALSRPLTEGRERDSGAAHKLDVLFRHRLLRQPGGFEGVVAGGEVLHPYHQATPQREERKEGFIERDPAARATPSLATSDEQAVAKVDDLLGFEPVVIRHLESRLPDADVGRVAVMNTHQIGWKRAADGAFVELELELLVKAEKENLEIPSIRGFVCPPKVVRGQRAAHSRAWR
jgi:hypothetical protein